MLEKLRSGLPATWPVTTRCLLLTYAYADLPLGKRFDVVFPRSAPEQVVQAPSVIVAVMGPTPASTREAISSQGRCQGRRPGSTRDGSHFAFQHSPTRAAQSSKRNEVVTWRLSQ